MRRWVFQLVLFALFSVSGCQQIPGPAKLAYDGQETHGGDISVAMVRVALLPYLSRSLRIESPLLRLPLEGSNLEQFVSELFFSHVVSHSPSEGEPIVLRKNGVTFVNRSRVLKMSRDEIRSELVSLNLGVDSPAFFKSYERFPKVNAVLTPNSFRLRSIELSLPLDRCLNGKQSALLGDIPERLFAQFPSGGIERLKGLRVRYSDGPLYDRFNRSQVDLGVVNQGLEVLINKERTSEWTMDNFGTDLLILHEISHLVNGDLPRGDSDFRVSAILYDRCFSQTGLRD